MTVPHALLVAGTALLLGTGGCYALRPSSGAGETASHAVHGPAPDAVAVPPGYRIEVVASRLTFPVGVTFDDRGRIHVVESGYSYGEVFAQPRLLRLEADGRSTVVATGDDSSGPWTGVTFHGGAFFVADGNVKGDGRLLRISADGSKTALVSGLPSRGDHHTNSPVAGPDGWIYFGQGTATNSGIVGPDNLEFGWLGRYPTFHDVPAQDVVLAGENIAARDVLRPESGAPVRTGPFLPFGQAATPGQVVRGAVKASGTVLRVRPEGGEPELVAWGFRNPFGLAFDRDGQLYASDNGYDDRGSRPVWGAPDVLWRVERGTWYGWPDFVGGVPITDPIFRPKGKPAPRFLLARHPNPPPPPVARFAVHSSADGLDFSRAETFGYAGQAFVAIFGDQAPTVGKMPSAVGGKVVRVDVTTGVITDFAVNRANASGPGTKVGVPGLERPVAVRFDPSGTALYVVDFGVLHMDAKGAHPRKETGAVWRITRQP